MKNEILAVFRSNMLVSKANKMAAYLQPLFIGINQNAQHNDMRVVIWVGNPSLVKVHAIHEVPPNQRTAP